MIECDASDHMFQSALCAFALCALLFLEAWSLEPSSDPLQGLVDVDPFSMTVLGKSLEIYLKILVLARKGCSTRSSQKD